MGSMGMEALSLASSDLVSTASRGSQMSGSSSTGRPRKVKPLDPSHPMMVRREHNQGYNDFLRQSHALRRDGESKAERARLVRYAGVDALDRDGPSMGMERGLDEPQLKMPSAGEPLWLANGASEGEGAGAGRRIPADENRLIVKKYASTPATQAELRDCSVELTQDELKLVQGSHKLLDFGRVSVGSTSAKSFSVANDLNQSVVVRVEELEAELSQSKHLCQVVPQGCLAGFDICFISRHVGKVKKVFQWKINSMHVSKVVVTAEVVPIELIMGVAELLMEFPFDSLEPSLCADLTLYNPGNAAADFLWGSAGAFRCSPETGSIGAGDTSVITVTWSPLSGKRNEEELGLHITGGVDQTLRVRGVMKETRAEFAEKRISLGTMAVGTEKVVHATVKNTGEHPLVYFLNPLDERLGIKASPEEELVLPGESATITLRITPASATTYDNVQISARVRGGKQITLKLTGSSIVPELTLFEESFHFGTVTVGGEQRLPLTIQNNTPILTTMILDLTQHPDFTPYIRGAADEEDALDLACVLGTVRPEQEDVAGNQVLLAKDFDSAAYDTGGDKRRGGKKQKPNVWHLLLLPNATLRADLVFRPSAAKQKGFRLPLFLQGIPENKSFTRDVTGTAETSLLAVTSVVVDFGDRVVSRDPLSRISYFLETTIKNITGTSSRRALTFEVREAEEVVREFGDADPTTPAPTPKGPRSTEPAEAKDKIFFVAPTKGDLGPGAGIPIRITFQPQSSANYSKRLELYIEGQTDPSRPYLTLLCQGSGVYPRLTFSSQHVSLPSVPLGVTSRACFTIFNNGYNSLDLDHRTSPNVPLPLDVSYPDGQSVGIMVQQIRVVVAFRSDTPVSFAGKVEFFDKEGERFCASVSGCADGCLLTNYPFVRDYAHEYGFMGADEQPVKYLKKGVIAELRQLEAKRKEEQRRLRSLERKKAVEGKDRGKKGDKDKGEGVKSPEGKKAPKSANLLSFVSAASYEPEGVDYTLPPPAAFGEYEPVFLLRWLNKNICRKKFDPEAFPHCVLQGGGEAVLECVELMCSKKIPGVKASDYVDPHAPSPHRGHSADDRRKKGNNKASAANRLVFKFQQLLNFLIGNGALLSHVSAVSMLGLEGHLLLQEADLTSDKSKRFTPAMLAERRADWEAHWLRGCKHAWLEVLYQSVKVFVLARVHYKAFSTMPGVVLASPAEEASPNPKAKKPAHPRDFAPSNVFTHAEAVLLQWGTYHLAHAMKLKDEGASSSGSATADGARQLSFARRVTDPDDFKDMVGFCQLIHSHVQGVTAPGKPLSGYSVMERGKGEDLYTMLEDQLGHMRMELDTHYEEVASSSRSLLLLLLHLFLHLPNLVPKTRVLFVGDLGTPIMQQVELRNPSKRPIEYSVSLTGSADFTAQDTTLVVPAESSAHFVVTLTSKFVEEVQGMLTFWSQRDAGLSGTTMCFELVSKITGRRPVDVQSKEMHLYELESFQVPLKSSSPKDTTYQVTLQIKSIPLTADEQIAISRGDTSVWGGGKRGRPKEFKPVLPLLSNVDVSIMSGPERKSREEESDLELTFRQPFWCNEESLAVSRNHPRTLTIYVLPFVMGRYSCQVVFTEKESGEFCHELAVDVGLPKPSDRLDFSGFKDTRVHLALRIASKNTAFERAFAALADMRIKNNTKKVRARSIFQTLVSSAVVNEETGQSHFLIEFLQQFFEYSKAVPFVSEYMKSANEDFPSSPSPSPAKKGAVAKYKKMLKTLVEPLPAEEYNSLDTLNTTSISFVPPHAGHYHSLAVVRSKDNALDVRVLELSAAVAMPDSKMGLEFVGPARQRLVQQIPVFNASQKDWNLLIVVAGKGFTVPKSLQVPAGQTAAVEVGFNAPKAGHYAGTLTLRNSSESSDAFEYKLSGEADDPLAEDDLHFEATARKKVSLSFKLPASALAPSAANTAPPSSPAPPDSSRSKARRYEVESDLPYANFRESVSVEAESPEFFFTMRAPIGGSFSGTFAFTDADTGSLFWYTVTVEVAAPKEERVIQVTAQVRKAAAVDITLENPTQEALLFKVQFQGEGLLGEESIELPPSSGKKAGDGSAVYELIYSPLLAGSYQGRISFTHELVGVLWYKLDLTAIPADPTRLPPIYSMMGARGSAAAPVENPSAEPVVFSVYVEDPEHFSVTPEVVSLGPYAQQHFQIHFTPSSLSEGASSRVFLQNARFGEVVYEVEGVPLMPGVMPALHIDAPLAEIGSQTLVFRNPFPFPLPLEITLTHAEPPTDPKAQRNRPALLAQLQQMQTAFALLSRKNSDVVVPAKTAHHIALSFSPLKMGTYEALVQVRSEVGGQQLLWSYPLQGMAEAGVAQRLPQMRTACKTTLMREFLIHLDGVHSSDLQPGEELQLSDFSVEVSSDESVQGQVKRAFRVQPLEVVRMNHSPPGSSPQLLAPKQGSSDFSLRCRLLFEPLRTFVASLDVVLLCRNRGKWRALVDLDATDPEPDDIIKLVAPVAGSDRVSFRLNNRFLGHSSFQAYYSAKSSPHFTVTPATGVLAPHGAEPTTFTVTFAPTEYGTIESGTLIIVTEDALWSYRVDGSYPSNTLNHSAIKSKIDTGNH